jgi:hypothetical protein
MLHMYKSRPAEYVRQINAYLSRIDQLFHSRDCPCVHKKFNKQKAFSELHPAASVEGVVNGNYQSQIEKLPPPAVAAAG